MLPIAALMPMPVGTFNEEQFLSLLMKSSLFERACEIEQILLEADNSAGLPYGKAYIDSRDAQWMSVGANVAMVDINQLSPRQFVVYQFGTFVVRLLRSRIATPAITLLLANHLPENDYIGNAFRNSYHFKPASGVLFVRRERMDDIGEFSLVIMHALAHIKINDMTHDTNPLFLDIFYKVSPCIV